MEKQEITIVNEEYLKNKIYIIRGQKVMLDSDLARIYGYTTKTFNRQVQRNNEKFDEDFMFKLNKNEERYILRCQNGTSSWGGSRYAHYVFTEQGIYMLMTVLKGELAIKQSKALIRLFKKMKDYIVENKELLPPKELELRTALLEKDVNTIKQDNKEIRIDLKKIIDYFKDPNTYKHFLILEGEKLEADIAYSKIFKQAKCSVIYIDDYISLKTLELLSFTAEKIPITIISDNKTKELKEYMIHDFNTQFKTNNLTILKSNNKCHDRFIILDFNTKNEKMYHCGSSLKDAGNKITTIQKIEDPSVYNPIITKFLKHDNLF